MCFIQGKNFICMDHGNVIVVYNIEIKILITLEKRNNNKMEKRKEKRKKKWKKYHTTNGKQK